MSDVGSPSVPADPSHSAGNATSPRAPQRFDVVVVGGGIVGLATAAALAATARVTIAVLEAESRLAAHQTGHNSGVIHSGLYYRPGSQKAGLCVAGRVALERFCEANEVPFERCGKLVVATDAAELPRLDELERRGRANGLIGLRRIGLDEMREREPHVHGAGALLVPETGIVDFGRVAAALAARLRDLGVHIGLDCRVRAVQREAGGLALETSQGLVRGRFLVACAGLQADRVARLCGVEPGVTIAPFRGEYWQLHPERRHLIRHLVYPVPDPQFPFLGVHFTRRIGGEIEAGPNAVLATAREGYRRTQFSPTDVFELMVTRGFQRLVRRHWRQALVEQHRSWSRRAFVTALQKLVPELRPEDVVPGGAGVRAQALDPQGRLVDDFHFVEAEGMIHVLNAPSPAATASLSIGREIAQRAVQRFRLQPASG